MDRRRVPFDLSQVTCWVCGRNPQGFERERARARQIVGRKSSGEKSQGAPNRFAQPKSWLTSTWHSVAPRAPNTLKPWSGTSTSVPATSNVILRATTCIPRTAVRFPVSRDSRSWAHVLITSGQPSCARNACKIQAECNSSAKVFCAGRSHPHKAPFPAKRPQAATSTMASPVPSPRSTRANTCTYTKDTCTTTFEDNERHLPRHYRRRRRHQTDEHLHRHRRGLEKEGKGWRPAG